jgi:hypothetical protein
MGRKDEGEGRRGGSRRGSTIGDAGDASPHRINQKILQPLNYGRRAQTGGPGES